MKLMQIIGVVLIVAVPMTALAAGEFPTRAAVSVPRITSAQDALNFLNRPQIAEAVPPSTGMAGTVPGNVGHALADMFRGIGDMNVHDAEAAIRLQQAWRLGLDNRLRAIEGFFQSRELNRQMIAAASPPRATPEQIARMAAVGIPRRLTPSDLDPVSGRINWPLLLTTSGSMQQRAELDRLFAVRAAKGCLNAQEYLEVENISRLLLDDLRTQVAYVPTQQYMRARRFMESLAFEADLRPGIGLG